MVTTCRASAIPEAASRWTTSPGTRTATRRSRLPADSAAAVPAILAAHPDVVVTDRIVEREHPLGIAEIIRGSARVRVLVLDLIEDEMRIYDGVGQGAAKLTSIIRAIEDAVERPGLPMAG